MLICKYTVCTAQNLQNGGPSGLHPQESSIQNVRSHKSQTGDILGSVFTHNTAARGRAIFEEHPAYSNGDAMGANLSRPNKHITTTRELKDVNWCFKQRVHI